MADQSLSPTDFSPSRRMVQLSAGVIALAAVAGLGRGLASELRDADRADRIRMQAAALAAQSRTTAAMMMPQDEVYPEVLAPAVQPPPPAPPKRKASASTVEPPAAPVPYEQRTAPSLIDQAGTGVATPAEADEPAPGEPDGQKAPD